MPEAAPIPTSEVGVLDVVYDPVPVGPGYARKRVRYGRTLDTGKYLGIGYGEGRFFGPEHVIVNHFSERPSNIGEGKLTESRLVNVRTGEVVLSMRDGRYLEDRSGLGIVWIEDDDRPYLLDSALESLTLAVPEGGDELRYAEDYWIHLHPDRKLAWVSAQDAEGERYLYLWPDHAKRPPPIPEEPFPVEFDPRHGDLDWVHPDNGDILAEVHAPRGGDEWSKCNVVSFTREGYQCRKRPGRLLSDGWRYTLGGETIYNEELGVHQDLDSLCDGEREGLVSGRVRSESPPRLELRCSNEFDFLAVWSPEGVARVPSKLLPADDYRPLYIEWSDQGEEVHFLGANQVKGQRSIFDANVGHSRLIGDDYRCPVVSTQGFHPVFAIACETAHHYPLWFDFVDSKAGIRAKFTGRAGAVSSTGLVVAVVRKGKQDALVEVLVKD
ncbi:hypothetical protein PPSIR1_03763 [Plesiocystis pacifica SIR-1]|uniref:Uncharacterized protein n=1 Tax=Plesiocystis pacifica SIR-1 TaxID=391625 RepID=A6G4B1_9BACT|nr:hypothetical protein PPSIR1_03763 [Plesiocystis pacifica SIR-1]